MFDLEKLDSLPKRISIRRDLVNKYGSIWDTRLDYNYSSKYDLYLLARRIIKNNIGKNYNNAFSYFIKKSKNYHNFYNAYYIFDKEFNRTFRYLEKYNCKYNVVDNNIQINTDNSYKFLKIKYKTNKHKENKKIKLFKLKYILSENKFREILNAKKLKDKEANDIIIIKHGFCPKTSFRNFI